MKSTYDVVGQAIDLIDTRWYPMSENNYENAPPSPYAVECERICKLHGWTLTEYDAELDRILLAEANGCSSTTSVTMAKDENGCYDDGRTINERIDALEKRLLKVAVDTVPADIKQTLSDAFENAKNVYYIDVERAKIENRVPSKLLRGRFEGLSIARSIVWRDS
jgi:hypothetical protein